MSDVVGRVWQRGRQTPATALFWRLFLLTALVLVAAAVGLVLTPATVSAPVSIEEMVVLVVGLAVLLTANAVLLRASLRPLDGLVGPGPASGTEVRLTVPTTQE
jgi:two-component system, NarL family, sensor histidine kinase UhpB